MTLEEFLDEIRQFIRSKRNLAIDRVEFEQAKQRDGEDFEDFY